MNTKLPLFTIWLVVIVQRIQSIDLTNEFNGRKMSITTTMNHLEDTICIRPFPRNPCVIFKTVKFDLKKMVDSDSVDSLGQNGDNSI